MPPTLRLTLPRRLSLRASLFLLLVLCKGLHARSYSFTNIPFPAGDVLNAGYPVGLNDAGQVVGSFLNDQYYGVQGFSYSNGNFTVIDFPGAGVTEITAINDLGQMVGTFSPAGGGQQGFLYANGTFSLIDDPDGVTTLPTGINNLGQIVGSYRNLSVQQAQGFLYSNGVYTTKNFPLAQFPSPQNFAGITGINDRGQLVGYGGILNPDGTFTPITYPDSNPLLVNRSNTENYFGINNAGTVVGTISLPAPVPTDTAQGFVYSNGSFTYVNAPGAAYPYGTTLTSINNLGDLAGYYSPGIGIDEVAFVATPVPEASALSLLGTGLLAVALAGTFASRGGQ